jgi:hypothetical protein
VHIDSLFNSEIGESEPGAAIPVSYDGEMIIGKGYGYEQDSLGNWNDMDGHFLKRHNRS